MNRIDDILIVGHDATIVSALKAYLLQFVPKAHISTVSNGSEALMHVQSHPLHLVVSLSELPGFSGIDLCRRIKTSERLSNLYVLLVTPVTKRDAGSEALNAGADDWVDDSYTAEELHSKIRLADRILDLQQSLGMEQARNLRLKVELERDFDEMTHLAAGLLQSRFAHAIQMLARVTETSLWIADQITPIAEVNRRDVEFASKLCYVGRLFLPDDLAGQPICLDGKPTHDLMAQVPHSAKLILSKVSRFSVIGDILHALYENFDGSGFPNHLQSWQIPMEARILRVVLDFEEMIDRSRKPPLQCLEMIKANAKRLYDARVVTILEEYVARFKGSLSKIPVRNVGLHELKAGMVLAREVTTNSGMKLLPANLALTDSIIQKVISHAVTDPIVGNIYIKA